MRYSIDEVREMLTYINSNVDEQIWIQIGMGLHEGGYPCSVWDEWSATAKSEKYKGSKCQSRWNGFKSNGGVTFGFVVKMAKDGGWKPKGGEDRAYTIGETLTAVELPDQIEPNHIPSWCKPLPKPPEKWQPVRELRRMAEAVFQVGDKIGYCGSFKDIDGKLLPSEDSTISFEKLMELTEKRINDSDLTYVTGTTNPQAGAYIRINPVNGAPSGANKTYKNDDATAWRYTLIECDKLPIEDQWVWLQKLELPVAVVIHSGNKSLHAWVKLNAIDNAEYSERRRYLERICLDNGFPIDTNTKNVMRYSRLPGAMRGDKPQYVMATAMGKPDWYTWKAWADERLSKEECLPVVDIGCIWDSLPPLSPPVIDGIVRQGHKMMISGQSKAGKSFLLAELALALTQGDTWLGFQCRKSRVLYINMEIDEASWDDRIRKIYDAKEYPGTPNGLHIMTLRGSGMLMDELLPKLIRTVKLHGPYQVIIVDPIYKVITGDENKASDMAKFSGYFDTLCKDTGCTVIYCHHFSKGGGNTYTNSMDKASGSGVFARDPDAIVTLTELDKEASNIARNDRKNKAYAKIIYKAVQALAPHALKTHTFEDFIPIERAQEICNQLKAELTEDQQRKLDYATAAADSKAKAIDDSTAWQVDATLREFPPVRPLRIWYEYPLHYLDDTGMLINVPIAQGQRSKNKTPSEGKREKKMRDYQKEFDTVFHELESNGDVLAKDMIEKLGVSQNTFKTWVSSGKIHGYEVTSGGGKGNPSLVRRVPT